MESVSDFACRIGATRLLDSLGTAADLDGELLKPVLRAVGFLPNDCLPRGPG